jgi:ParB family chromosome partitioning protein
MTEVPKPSELRMIPIDKIEILNPRERNTRVFEEIVVNIKTIGLKKPITVTPRFGPNGEEHYLLICGEGRLKAFRSLGEATIPALVVKVSDEDAYIMSLAENIARRQCRPLELLAGIQRLRDQGYDKNAIAEKVGFTPEYIYGILLLLQNGEERLVVAVERGRIPLNTALAIVGAGDSSKAVQVALQDAYESGKLRGKQLLQARRIIERRQTLGRSVARGTSRKREDVTTSSLVRVYTKEVERQKLMVKKAEFTQQRLLFVVGALREMLADENFTNLLRAEGLDTLPKYLAERVWAGGHIT